MTILEILALSIAAFGLIRAAQQGLDEVVS